MAALTTNTDRGAVGEFARLALKAAARPFQGSLLGLDTNGFARALVAGDRFMGINRQRLESAPATDGGAFTEATTGVLTFWVAAITGVSTGLAAIGTKVYAANDNDLTNASTGNTLIGTVSNYNAAQGYQVRAFTYDIANFFA
jgi:hypothetical protein